MRCPDCNRFVGLELQDPEDVELDLEEELGNDCCELTVTMRCRIVRNCAECGQELKSADVEAEDNPVRIETDALEGCTVVLKDGSREWKANHGDLSADVDSTDQLEEGGGRYKKSYFGATVQYQVKCTCGEVLHEGILEGKVAASEMEECV